MSLKKKPVYLLPLLILLLIGGAKLFHQYQDQKKLEIVNGPVCDTNTYTCTEPKGWVAIVCDAPLKYTYFINVEIEKLQSISRGIEYDISVEEYKIQKAVNVISWGLDKAKTDIFPTKIYHYHLNRTTLELETSFISTRSFFPCKRKTINEAAAPIFDYIKKWKKSNKI